ncbi:hypothetical protein ACRAQ7_10870 [Erythrobacter sp. W53]|uniref:hypothetical protein n=1 Tax=Erythrobacter sp. W53 TaxID=3425947 RepID=UPI003D769175
MALNTRSGVLSLNGITGNTAGPDGLKYNSSARVKWQDQIVSFDSVRLQKFDDGQTRVELNNGDHFLEFDCAG